MLDAFANFWFGLLVGSILGLWAMYTDCRHDVRRGVIKFGRECYRTTRVKEVVWYKDEPK